MKVRGCSNVILDDFGAFKNKLVCDDAPIKASNIVMIFVNLII
jgi:hypothetical protein